MPGKTPAPAVTCIGLANVDVIADVDDDFLRRHRLKKGESNILSEKTVSVILNELDNPLLIPGGCAANTACGLAAQGISTRFIGPTGTDRYAPVFAKGFADYGVQYDTPPLTDHMTSLCLCLVSPDKSHSFVFSRDTAGWHIDARDLPDDPGRVVYVESNLAVMPDDILLKVIGTYEPGRTAIIFNLNDSAIINAAPDLIRGLIHRRIDIFIGNEGEAHTFFGTSDIDNLRRVILDSGQTFVITRGALGAEIIGGGRIEALPAAPVPRTTIVNSIGAGDQFAAGMMTGLVKGEDLSTAAQRGIVLAAAILRVPGARPPLTAVDKTALTG